MSFQSLRPSRRTRSRNRRAQRAISASLFESLEPRALLAASPLPGLVIDVRLPDGGKTITNVSPGQVIPLEVWATVTGSNSTGEDDFLKSFNGSFLSTNIAGGAVLGSLQATRLAPFAANGSDDGQLIDLDGDGDLDVGSNDGLHHAGFFAARYGGSFAEGIVDATSQSYKVATLTFTVEQLLPGQETQINFRPRTTVAEGALWFEDYATLKADSIRDAGNGTYTAGTPVIISNPSFPTEQDGAVNYPPFFVNAPVPTVLNNAGLQTIPNWATQISPGRPEESAQALAFLVSTDNPSLFAVQPTVSPDGTLSFVPAPGNPGTAWLTVLLQDDGGTANGGIDTSIPHRIPITILSPNTAPSFTKGPDLVVDEDSGLQEVTGWATDISRGLPDECNQCLAFIVQTDNNLLAFLYVLPNGSLQFNPGGGAFGTTTVTVLLKDNGGTASGGCDTSPPQTFTITVNPVNDAPTFSLPNNSLEVNDTSGAQQLSWAFSISAGLNENNQTLNFQVATDNNTLFAVPPAISPNGTLTYTPAPGASGTATVTVLLKDNGGTENGGVDTSIPRTFTITVNPASQPPAPPASIDPPANPSDDPIPPTTDPIDPVTNPPTPPTTDPTSPPTNPTDPTPPGGSTLPVIPPIDPIIDPIIIDPPYIIDPPGWIIFHPIDPPFIKPWPIDPAPIIIAPPYQPPAQPPAPSLAPPPSPSTPPIGPGLPASADDSNLIEVFSTPSRRKPKDKSLDIPAAPQPTSKRLFNFTKPIVPQTPPDSATFLTRLRHPTPRPSSQPAHPLLTRLHRS